MFKSATRVCAAAVVALVGSTASAATFTWDWARGAPGSYGLSDVAGKYESIHAEYNNVTREFIWNTTFSDKITQGYTLAVNKGPNPKGVPGELALIYLDATTMSSPKITAYGYNGANVTTSWKDGDGVASGDQSPDKIKSKSSTSWIKSVSVQDVGAKRVFSLKIDATDLNLRTSPYTPAGVSWTGIQFAQQLGLWFHTYNGLSTTYDANGYLTKWSFSNHGYFDGDSFPTVVPLPTALPVGSAGLVGVAVLVRRRNRAV